RILRSIGILFVVAPEISAGVIYALNHLEWVRLVRSREPGHLPIKFTLIHRQRAFQDSRCDRSADAATVFAALHNYGDHILGIVKWCKTGEPRDCVFVAAIGGLGRSGFPGNLHIL